MPIEKMVLGFLFDHQGNVVLLQKTHPTWQKGLYNGVGGHIKKRETPLQAMCREFEEEAGVATTLPWRKFLLLKGKDYEVHCFTAKSSYQIVLASATAEVAEWVNVYASLHELPLIANLRWIIPMAQYKHEITGTIYYPSPTC